MFERIVERTKLTETVTRRLTRRLFNAMHYLHHKHRMVHRDLKPENILLSSKTNDYLCKISDFGVAKILKMRDSKHFVVYRNILLRKCFVEDLPSKSVADMIIRRMCGV